jgi:hypothetical protein
VETALAAIAVTAPVCRGTSERSCRLPVAKANRAGRRLQFLARKSSQTGAFERCPSQSDDQRAREKSKTGIRLSKNLRTPADPVPWAETDVLPIQTSCS